MARAERDANRIPTMIGVSSADGITIVLAEFDPDTGELLVKPTQSTASTVYNITLTSADTQYSQAIPASTLEIRFRCRTLYDVRYAWITGKVATPTAPYLTLPAGSDYHSDANDLNSQTIYLASAQAGVVVEVETWS